MATQTSTVIGLDVGERRIGVAIALLVTRLPQPHGVIAAGEQAITDICELANAQQATALVIGLPRGLDGQETSQTKQVRDFASDLSRACKLPIHFQDEALTSKQAKQELSERGISYTKGAVDALAAVYILNDFLEEHPEISNE